MLPAARYPVGRRHRRREPARVADAGKGCVAAASCEPRRFDSVPRLSFYAQDQVDQLMSAGVGAGALLTYVWDAAATRAVQCRTMIRACASVRDA